MNEALQALSTEASGSPAGATLPYYAIHTQLKAEYLAAGRAWNAKVEAAQEAKMIELIATTPVPMGVDPRFMRGHLVLSAAPVWKRYREARYTFPSYQEPEQEELRRDVEMFLAHAALHGNALGLS
jgi:hypothetical protein